MSSLLPQWSGVNRAVIGMVHLLPLPGSPRYEGDVAAIRAQVLADAEALVEGGVHALMIENFGDVPFFPGRVPAETVAGMTALACEVRRRFHVPIGINVLRNDALSAMAVAHASRADFIRVNVLCGARVADQGILQGVAHDLLRLRKQLGATHVKIFADVDVKHSAPLAPRGLAEEVWDTTRRGLADALIVSGTGTGKTTDPAHLRAVKAAAGTTPVFVGSGVSASTLPDYLPDADGFIVGSSFKQAGNPTNRVEVERVRELVGRLRG